MASNDVGKAVGCDGRSVLNWLHRAGIKPRPRYKRVGDDPVKRKASSKRYYLGDKAKTQYRKQRLKDKYGLTPEQFDAVLASQGGVCCLCKKDNPGGQYGKWCVDHDHRTKLIRGLLCNRCNTVLGQLGDTSESVAAWAKQVGVYLEGLPTLSLEEEQ